MNTEKNVYIQLNNLRKSYASADVIRGLNLGIFQGEFISVVGPSGVGKTTLLRILAGLETSDSGEISLMPDSGYWDPILMVFQDFMLFPHLTVAENIAYGLRSPEFARRLLSAPVSSRENSSQNGASRKYGTRRPLSRKEKSARIQEMVTGYIQEFGLQGLENSYPSRISAGEKQRTALARTMILQPKLLLLDEPFANLDQNRKMNTALFIRNMQKKHQVTTLAVTHDLQEAFAMSDRIGVMLDGDLAQVSDVETLYSRPASREVGEFLGPLNILPPRIWNECRFTEDLPTPGEQNARLLIRSESISAGSDASGKAVITSRRFQGTLIHLEAEILGTKLQIYSLQSRLKPGDRVSLTIHDYVIHKEKS
ncbi:ABC transporter ATP-binding protein [Salinispira pacifica]|uniref:Putrescine transport ATP-binding protein PotA n=1 Tax=Salinispira pacifica TaxID=1307761 RepID=V5WIQ9_9SPIO|nr:ABC transporter ATP-binding protein [Salinispira pacifica]AHC15678.1 Putrescine transport ATP-binding protein PotA [Salinispira pacifica]